jgi:outer membrane protein insertion porin family
MNRVVALLLLSSFTSAASAQTPAAPAGHVGRMVTEVRLLSEEVQLRDPLLLNLVDTKPNAPLSMAEVRESIVHLMAMGRYQDVRVDAEPQGAGVVLTYTLIPLHVVRRLDFRGELGLSESEVRSAVVERFGATPRATQAREIVAALEQLYADRGYMKAQITPREVVDHRSETTDLIFDVAAGRRARLLSVDVQATPPSETAAARERVGVAAGDPYDPSTLQRRITSYRDALRARGFYEATVVSRPRPTPETDQVALTVSVDRGPLVRVEFTGDVPETNRDELVPIQREASVDEDLLEDSERRITDYWKARGYRDATASYRRTAAGDRLTITFDVKRGTQFRVADLRVDRNAVLPPPDLEPALTIKPGDPFVQARLEAAKAAIVELYRLRGYEQAEVRDLPPETALPRDRPPGVTWLNVRLVVTEGVQTRIGGIRFAGNASLPETVLGPVVGSIQDGFFYRPQLVADRDALQLLYLNRGYLSATVTVDPKVSEDGSRADLTFTIQEGPQITVDHVLVVGNQRTSLETIQRELLIKPGQPLGFNDQVETRRRLIALGLFRGVTVAELQHGTEARRDVLITVEEAPATAVGFGGGFEFQTADRIEAAPRGFFEIGRRNLGGKNRSLDLFTRVSVRLRNRVPTSSDAGFTRAREYRVVGTYREPKLFGSTADGLATIFFEQASRPSFSFTRRGSNVEVARRLPSSFSLSGRYSLERTALFNEQIAPEDRPLIDRAFPQVRLSGFSSSLIRDTRDDPLDPVGGQLTLIDGELDARALGSEVGFVKTLVQAFVYRQLPAARRLIFAAGARLGLAAGFPRNVPRTDDQGRPVVAENGTPILDEVRDVPASKRFFAGGDTTVRGFALDSLGRPNTIGLEGVSKGGDAFAVFNAELRGTVLRGVPFCQDVEAVGFFDVGNVYRRVSELDFAQLRSAAGFGARCKSPFGPLRFDMGFKLKTEELVPGSSEKPWAIHISIGQAF